MLGRGGDWDWECGRAMALNNFQRLDVLLIWIIYIIEGQGPTVLAVGAGGVVWILFSHLSFLFSVSLSLWETARYRLKCCLKGTFNPNQPTNQLTDSTVSLLTQMAGRMGNAAVPEQSYIGLQYLPRQSCPNVKSGITTYTDDFEL